MSRIVWTSGTSLAFVFSCVLLAGCGSSPDPQNGNETSPAGRDTAQGSDRTTAQKEEIARSEPPTGRSENTDPQREENTGPGAGTAVEAEKTPDIDRQEIVDRIRREAAKLIETDAIRIDVARPLMSQGLDDLNIVELVLELEEAYGMEIPDSLTGTEDGGVAEELTVDKLADFIAARLKVLHENAARTF